MKVLEIGQFGGKESKAFTLINIGIMIGIHLQFSADQSHNVELSHEKVLKYLNPKDFREFELVIVGL